MASLKETLHKHTPIGRYGEYRMRHDYLLDQTRGEARYMLEKTLDHDAKAYATKKVAGEIIATALIATGALTLGIELKRGTFESDVRKAASFVIQIPDTVKASWNGFLNESGQKMGEAAAESAASVFSDRMNVEKAGFEAYLKSLFTTLRNGFNPLKFLKGNG